MNLFQPTHLIILVIVLVVLFGAKRLPDSARALGKSMKIFKNEVKELNADKPKEEDSDGEQKNSGA